ncbi:MAG: FMN-binding glutamate synthase family protein [Myxococcales bacterium]|nr:FMN-binding glutamate synthase family protein [Myxococcales bacterium]
MSAISVPVLLGGAVVVLLIYVVLRDITQKQHAIKHNYPIIGRLRYLLERFGPELRQYIVTNNDEERPFSRDQRRWVYASAKQQNNLFGFGTDNEVEAVDNYLIFKQATFPYAGEGFPGPMDAVPCTKIMGGPRGRKHAFRPASIVNSSAMSFGSLSATAVEALNRGAALSGSLQNTGEGGIASHHDHGGGLIWQIGTGYFGCRDGDGNFSLEMLKDRVERFDVRMLEIKLSQGAKPGKGGVLPGAKVTPEIAAIRGVPVGETVYSPSSHKAFSDADSMLDFVELLAAETGLPVGIKSAVGQTDFFVELAELMSGGQRGVDFIQIDGGEGGTGAAPLVFSDHVSLPWKLAFTRVYRIFAERQLQHDLVWVGSGRLGLPPDGLLALALGCDMLAVAREAMLAIGCIQAQKCHTGHCPAGVATQQRWLMKGLDPTLKGHRYANYIGTLRHELLALGHAMGYAHPALVDLDAIEIIDGGYSSRPAREVFGYDSGWGAITDAQRAAVLATRTS